MSIFISLMIIYNYCFEIYSYYSFLSQFLSQRKQQQKINTKMRLNTNT
jgi:hypothetical protein